MGKGLQPDYGVSRSFVALHSLEIARENEILLQTIQLFACCLLELIFHPDHYPGLTGRFAHTKEGIHMHACMHMHTHSHTHTRHTHTRTSTIKVPAESS